MDSAEEAVVGEIEEPGEGEVGGATPPLASSPLRLLDSSTLRTVDTSLLREYPHLRNILLVHHGPSGT